MEEKTSDDEFLEFVRKKLEEMEYIVSLDPYSITYQKLNEHLANYEKIYLQLIGLSIYLERELDILQRDFDIWYAEKYNFIRLKENRMELSAQKWVSQKEIDYLVKITYKDEYLEKHKKVLDIQHKLNFVNSTLKAWISQLSVLLRLSSNLDSEIKLEGIKNN
ncbi:MAG TPA: hypothetical protein PLI42_00730 [Candidatus Pacearchaeota archaeon]|nr:hypothetical protein [Candidatus Pacearchaeota archaeon]HOS12508.1 hypothetical protein [Candidatus Pacearchaeota archaeon]